MIPRPQLATFSLLLLLTAFFVLRPLRANDERAANQLLAESLLADNSASLPQAAQPGQTADLHSPANETGPLFPVVEHGKWGYIDKTGKIVIPLHYYFAYPFSEGFAFIQQFPNLGGKSIRLQFIDKAGLMVMSKAYAFAQPFSEGLAVVAVPGERGLGLIDKTGKMVTSQ